MPVVKRYPNRKLYDTDAKQYITLAEIGEIIRRGQEVSVIDHATGDDLTTVTLTQVILEQEKKRSGFLPKAVLAGLIQAGGETMGTLRRTLASPLNLARQVDEEIECRLQALISRGELATEEGFRLRSKLLAQSDRPPGDMELSEQDMQRVLAERGVPSQEEFQQVLEQLDALAAKLESLGRSTEPA
jgi:polyhydroxyalkanoate synthesis repressor PhaR